jgi:hypothetical protein
MMSLRARPERRLSNEEVDLDNVWLADDGSPYTDDNGEPYWLDPVGVWFTDDVEIYTDDNDEPYTV